jgi:hypothetical protein
MCGKSAISRALSVIAVLGWASIVLPSTTAADEVPVDEPRIEALQSLLPGATAVYHSPHFSVVTTGSEGATVELRLRLEGLYRAHQAWLAEIGIDPTPLKSRIVVGYVATHRAFVPLRASLGYGENVAGFFDEDENWCIFFDLKTDPRIAARVNRVAVTEDRLRDQIRAHRAKLQEYREAIAQLKARIAWLEREKENPPNRRRDRGGSRERDETYYDTQIRLAQMQLDKLQSEEYEAQFAAAEEDLKAQQAQVREVRQEVDLIVRRMIEALIQHEAAHALQFNLGVFQRKGSAAAWLVEGLAAQFEQWSRRNHRPFENVNYTRAKHVRTMFADPSNLPDLSAVIRGEIPAGDEVSLRFQSLAWALVFYLQDAFADEWPRYLRAVTADPPAPAAARVTRFEAHFGPLNDRWRQRFLGFMRGLPTEPPAEGDAG